MHNNRIYRKFVAGCSRRKTNSALYTRNTYIIIIHHRTTDSPAHCCEIDDLVNFCRRRRRRWRQWSAFIHNTKYIIIYYIISFRCNDHEDNNYYFYYITCIYNIYDLCHVTKCAKRPRLANFITLKKCDNITQL